MSNFPERSVFARPLSRSGVGDIYDTPSKVGRSGPNMRVPTLAISPSVAPLAPHPPKRQTTPHHLHSLSVTELFPLAQADAETYASVIKSDIFKIQDRLASIEGPTNQPQSGRPSSRGASKKRNDLTAAKTGTLDIDIIVEQCRSDPSSLKLRLLEHLHAKMVSLELEALTATDAQAAQPYRPPLLPPATYSRMGSYFALIDRLREFQSRLGFSETNNVGRAPPDGSIERYHSQGSNAPEESDTSEIIEHVGELEDQIKLLEAELGMPLQSARKRAPKDANGLTRRLQSLGEKLEVARESGVRFLQEELDEVKASRNSLSAALRDAREQIATLEASVNTLSSSAKTGKRGSSSEPVSASSTTIAVPSAQPAGAAPVSADTSRAEVEALLKQLEFTRQELSKQAKEKEEHAKSIQRLQKLVESYRTGEETRFSEALELKRAHHEALRKISVSVAEKQSELLAANAQRVALEAQVLSLQSALAQSQSAQSELLAHSEEKTALLRGESSLMAARLEELSQRNSGVPPARDSVETELRAALGQLVKTKRAYEHLELFYRDSEKQRGGEIASLNEELRQMRRALEIKETALRDTSLLTSKYAESVKSCAAGTDSIVLEEMRVLKQSFELRLAESEAQLSAQRIASSRERKEWLVQLSEERTSYTKTVARLRASLDKLSSPETEQNAALVGKWTTLLLQERKSNHQQMDEA